MRTRTVLAAGAAVLTLTAGSLAALAATGTGTAGSFAPGWRSTAGTFGQNGCSAPTTLPGQHVTVILADMGAMMGGSAMMGGRMMLRANPQTVQAGTVSLLATNHGTRTHELLVLPLTGDTPVGARVVGADRRITETTSLGEASNDCGPGAGEGIEPGGLSWLTLQLPTGRYELACNLPGHYTTGMYIELDVT